MRRILERGMRLIRRRESDRTVWHRIADPLPPNLLFELPFEPSLAHFLEWKPEGGLKSAFDRAGCFEVGRFLTVLPEGTPVDTALQFTASVVPCLPTDPPKLIRNTSREVLAWLESRTSTKAPSLLLTEEYTCRGHMSEFGDLHVLLDQASGRTDTSVDCHVCIPTPESLSEAISLTGHNLSCIALIEGSALSALRKCSLIRDVPAEVWLKHIHTVCIEAYDHESTLIWARD